MFRNGGYGSMMNRPMLTAAIAAATLLPAWNAATAQDAGGRRVRVGLGAQVQPDFPGSDNFDIAPLWHLNFARGDEQFKFAAPDDKAGISVVSTNGFSFGPLADLESGRKNSDVGAPVGKVPTTFEAGAFAQYYVSKSIRVRGEVLKGIGGHKGLLGSIGADQVWRDGDRYVISVGPRLLVSDSRYQRAFFGVTPAAALASGLPVYRPGGGVYALALASGISYQLDPNWGLFGFARYERLVGDAAKSPIVRRFGSRNQASGGLGLSYTFSVR